MTNFQRKSCTESEKWTATSLAETARSAEQERSWKGTFVYAFSSGNHAGKACSTSWRGLYSDFHSQLHSFEIWMDAWLSWVFHSNAPNKGKLVTCRQFLRYVNVNNVFSDDHFYSSLISNEKRSSFLFIWHLDIFYPLTLKTTYYFSCYHPFFWF